MRQFSQDDYKYLLRWWEAWDAEPVPFYLLPKTGFINENAAGFVLKTDGPICFIEALVNNRAASSDTRNSDTDAIIDACLDFAKSEGFEFVYALTNNKNVVDRATRHRFTLNNCYALMQREI